MRINTLSIVIPCFNEQDNIKFLFEELKKVLNDFDFVVEMIFVDDGSKDGTFGEIEKIADVDNRVTGISFSRNFGHQIALLAGMEKAKGDAVVTMDGDLQHPPEVIPEMIQQYNQGYDIVNTKRIDGVSTSLFKRKTSKWFYALINKLSDVRVEPNSADFRLMSRETVDAFLKIKEQDRFTRGLISWIGFKQTFVAYTSQPRYSGKTSYTLKKMLVLAVNGITSMSSKPLRISLYLGLLFFVTGIVYSIFILYNFFKGVNVEGWTSILITILILGGVQLFIMSIIGEYVSRIFNETKARPLYLVKKETGQKS
ncbi:glycosyltransferase family 2 protein [Aquimarina sp. TRL1]|uniref:glycosyltransferase family 2 protein n=1 Tax=Aquimarina sp. (strain TRL1) TaxID=2736252 RepID=UPI00158B1931|nr:glycosyltransferase family 2 protein [Aquimarina sp. TRL1]QKX05573.1 glycosyltransferase family 2 protein [Aquimarina sp. TRL1]